VYSVGTDHLDIDSVHISVLNDDVAEFRHAKTVQAGLDRDQPCFFSIFPLRVHISPPVRPWNASLKALERSGCASLLPSKGQAT
jgi:hypothetical protein